MAKKVKEESVNVEPVKYPLLKKAETYTGVIGGVKFQIIPQQVAYEKGKPYKLPAVVLQDGKANEGEYFVDLSDEQIATLQKIGMI